MNNSMTILASVMEKIENIPEEDKCKISGIVSDASETTKNLKKFSEKLNKRFLLFRLMF
jgi:hypothetical protein